MLGIGVAGVALEQAIPFGRVWSFPKEIIIPSISEANNFLTIEWVTAEVLRILVNNLQMTQYFVNWDEPFIKNFAIGQRMRVRFPPERLPG